MQQGGGGVPPLGLPAPVPHVLPRVPRNQRPGPEPRAPGTSRGHWPTLEYHARDFPGLEHGIRGLLALLPATAGQALSGIRGTNPPPPPPPQRAGCCSSAGASPPAVERAVLLGPASGGFKEQGHMVTVTDGANPTEVLRLRCADECDASAGTQARKQARACCRDRCRIAAGEQAPPDRCRRAGPALRAAARVSDQRPRLVLRASPRRTPACRPQPPQISSSSSPCR